MAQTFRSHCFHLIWSTKDRKDIISKEMQPRLFAYMGGIIKRHQGTLLKIGGTSNHVHLLIGTNSLDKYTHLIRALKAKSTLWVHEHFPMHKHFAWQGGYGSFSVSYSSHEKVKNYIENQAEHHKKFSFEVEFMELLEKHNVKYDERFVLG